MSDAPSQDPRAIREDDPTWRIVLIGRGEIEATLRRAPEIELVRCRAPELAPGALAECRRDALSGAGPSRTAVLVCVGAVEAGDHAGLLRSLAMIDPTAPVVVIGGPRVPGAGWLPKSASAEEFLASLGAGPAGAGVAPEIAAPHQWPGADSALGGSGVAPPPVGDATTEQSMLRALLSGSDLVGPALDRLRAALGDVEAGVRPASGDGSAPQVGPGEVAIAAEHRGRVFAWLVGPRSFEGALRTEARTLALWMAVGEQHSQLRSAAFTDPLTGAWNRRYLERFLDMALDRARRDRRGVTLLLFDIDNFKHYNDNYGHPAGDEILRETVRLLTSVIRPTDRVCRIGGDEFAVVFDDPSGPRRTDSQPPSSIHEITRRFQRQITEHRFPKLGEQARAPLTISGGMVTFPWDAADAATLLERADRLILDSKIRGKNVICFGPGALQALGFGTN